MSPSNVSLVVVGSVFVVDLVVRVIALIVIPRDRKPTAATAWLLAIFSIPLIGVFFFLLIGNSRLPRDRREKQKRIDAVIAESNARAVAPANADSWPTWLPSAVELACNLGSTAMVDGNQAELLPDYQGSIDRMSADVGAATRFVHVEFYILSLDATTRGFFRALEEAVQRGVAVRVLLDHIASVRAAGHKETIAELDRIGAQWSFMLPVQPLKGKYQRPDLRNHRKIVVVDGIVGFMGSQNMVSRDYNAKKNISRGLQWQELVTRVTGPVVSGMNTIFLGDWYTETNEVVEQHEPVLPVGRNIHSLDCSVVPSGPGYDDENNLRVFLSLLHSAQRRIIITSPYFVPDEALMYAITSAARRGLDVQLFVSAIGDQAMVYHAQRSYYASLLRAGVRIFRYPAPYILHAKHFSIDESVAVIGSSNMDIRSFALDLEVSLLVHGEAFVRDMRAVEDDYRSISAELTMQEWEAEPRTATFLDGIARLTSALQ
jgi:cardiolipin synthase